MVRIAVFARRLSMSAVRMQQVTPLPLHLRPEAWRGRNPDEIFKLYKMRLAALGTEYKRDPRELEALLSTSSVSGLKYDEIEALYYGGELESETMLEIDEEDDDELEFPKYEHDEYSTVTQDIIDEHREQREFNRIAAYEMPHLAKFRQEYTPIKATETPVKLRYTSYLGEDHPAEKKVVLTTVVADLGLGEAEAHKFKVLAGVRYNYKTDTFKMSSDRFAEATQNSRYLSDTLNALLRESKDLSNETFADIPLDVRHITAKDKKQWHHAKRQYSFPKEWRKPQDKNAKKFNPFKDAIGGSFA
ncbi:unnamed protein product [Kuraishia capsulata CBS 1993]|uniref:Small ribosomal subunit protein mS35 n=1 Tax=Kuraishia capsulata CBS 1993 TaxID=1382522 RepID=W6MP10_9ASCO|nr:uncharacterized protein KUCA_T00004348001 [Kuraishia capsulata CBS 1993]CDK28366.1 unnamed protein product [Kuraishia capsulata CBS 1993]